MGCGSDRRLNGFASHEGGLWCWWAREVAASEKLAARLTGARVGVQTDQCHAVGREEAESGGAGPGTPGGITIATNMAGRGADIKLGGVAGTRSSPRNGTSRAGWTGNCLVVGRIAAIRAAPKHLVSAEDELVQRFAGDL